MAGGFAGVYELGGVVEYFFLSWSDLVLNWGVFYTYYSYRL